MNDNPMSESMAENARQITSSVARGGVEWRTQRLTITVEPGAFHDMPIINLIRFLSANGLRLDSDMVIRRVK